MKDLKNAITLKIGIIREGKTPTDERVPLSPQQCKEIIDKYPHVSLVVQNSTVRRYQNDEYKSLNIEMVDSVDDCDVLLGVKEVPVEQLIPEKTYFFFSHTTKEQPYNRSLLKEMLHKHITMVDYEEIRDGSGKRLIGFGRYAGIVGCYNTFYAYGQKYGTYNLKRAYKCKDRAEMESELSKVKLPHSYKIVVTGDGRVANGAIEIIEKLGIRRVSPHDILTKKFNEPVYAQLLSCDYYKRKDGRPFKKSVFYKDPSLFESNFRKYASVCDMYIPCHFWDSKSSFIFTRSDARQEDFKMKIIGDISCDIDGPVASTIRPSTIKHPLYGYDPHTESEVSIYHANAITVMAVDNLPCELPKDASEDFGREFINKVLPHLIDDDKESVIKRATICKNGKLTSRFEYLKNYVTNGNGTASSETI
jgi:saccharopine dehydrogenase (NAD+, L-lysine forming)